MAFASWWYATHGDKKTAGTTKPADKKTPDTAEKKQGTTSASTSASSTSTAASAVSSKVPASQDSTMKPTDPKAKPTPKPEPPKSTQTTQPKTTTAVTTTSSTSLSSSTSKPSTEKSPTKQDAKKGDDGKPKDTAVTSSFSGKAAAAAVGAAAVGAAAVGTAAVVSSSKPTEKVKEEKKLSVDIIAATSAPSKSEKDDALDLLIDSLGTPESVPESPKFTGPEIDDKPFTSEHLERLGERESSIPPKYRDLLDGKGEKPKEPPAKAAEESLGDEDLIAAMSSEFVCSPFQPEEKKPKLEEKVVQKASTAPIASSRTQPSAVPDEALDALLGTLEGPPAAVPESPRYTGPEVTENITSSYVEGLGVRDGTIPPAYRNLLDGKDNGKPLPPPSESHEPAVGDADVLEALSKDFEFSLPPSAKPSAPPAAATPKDTTKYKPVNADVVVPSSASSVQAAAKPSAGMADALDELMGSLEGPEFSAPESPTYTGPEVTDTATATYFEGLGKRESSIPPAYRHLLDGTEGGKPAPPSPLEKDKGTSAEMRTYRYGKPLLPTPAEKPQALSEDDLVDAFNEGFVTSPAVSKYPPLYSSEDKGTSAEIRTYRYEKPLLPTPAEKPQKPKSEEIVSCAKASSVQSSAPKPLSAAYGAKSPSIPDDALNLLSDSLGTRKRDPDEKKPIVDVVKEKVKKQHIEQLGDRDDTIPPEYRNLLDGKDQGKPAKPETVKPKTPLSDDAAIDALSGGFSPCDTGSADKGKSSSQDKTEKSASSTPVSRTAEAIKDKTGKSLSSTPTSQTAGKTPDPAKPTSQSFSTTPSASKIGKS